MEMEHSARVLTKEVVLVAQLGLVAEQALPF